MKKFNNEENRVHVQLIDIEKLKNSMCAVPAAVFAKLYLEPLKVNEKNQFTFATFDGKESMDFFKEIDWIIDYDKAINLSDKEIELKIKQLCKEISQDKEFLDRKKQEKELLDRKKQEKELLDRKKQEKELLDRIKQINELIVQLEKELMDKAYIFRTYVHVNMMKNGMLQILIPDENEKSKCKVLQQESFKK